MILTSLPSESLPNMSLGDKTDHFLAYFVLGFLLYLNFLFQDTIKFIKSNPFISSLIFASLYALFDELHQIFIPGRYAEFMDWLADFIGSFIGISLASILVYLFKENIFKFFNKKLETISN